MSAMILRLDDATMDRLEHLSEVYGTDVQTVITRLLERDPHEHDHRCPTCVRLAAHETTTSERLAVETPLFA